jgi:hypothetical protein
MKLAFLLVIFASCTDSYGALTLDPSGGPPLGVGLTARYTVTQDLCEGGVDGTCGNSVYPAHFSVAVASGTAVEVTRVNMLPTTFDLTGVAEGSARVAVTGNAGITTTLPVAVAPVASTTLFVRRPVGHDVLGAVSAFPATAVHVSQTHLDANQSPLSGAAPLQLDPGTAHVAYDPTCDCFATGSVLGRAVISAPTASLALDVVDASAIADFTFGAPGSTLTLYFGGPATSTGAYVLPLDSNGKPIIGQGPDAVVTIADPTVVSFRYNAAAGVVHVIALTPERQGTTTLDITWGSVHKTYKVDVVPPQVI